MGFALVLSALAMREALGEFNRERQSRHETPLEMGIGIHTASRIEGLTKVFQVPVIISLYELIHRSDAHAENKIRHTQEFEACVKVWEVSPGEAESRFLDYAKIFPEDPALNFFLGKSSL